MIVKIALRRRKYATIKYMDKIKVNSVSKLIISTILIILSTVGVLLQNILKIKPFCSGCRELGCAFCEIEFNFLIFIAWLTGLILLIIWIKSNNLKKLNISRIITVIMDILLLCFCFIFPCIFLVQMFLPYNPS